jgi:Acetyltransferase (GNAT) domain
LRREAAVEARDTYRTLFCQMYGKPRPVVALSEIIHWWAIVRELGLGHLAINQQTAYVADGYFYAVHLSQPKQRQVKWAFAEARAHSADWVLFPVVRPDPPAAALGTAGFQAVPWFVEAEYRVRAGVDDDLCAQLGKLRYRDLRRLVRRADEEYTHQILSGEELADAKTLMTFDRLHQMNLEKYGHRHNHLSLPALRVLLESPLGGRLRLFLRRPRAGGDPVQAALGLLDGSGRTMTLLAQSINRDAVLPRQNLYKAYFYQTYQWGVANGVEVFSLGRGAELKKLDMGANTFYRLDNHIAPLRQQGTADLAILRDRLTASFADLYERITETIAHRGISDRIELHW